MALSWDPKDPNEILDYVVDWVDRLELGDTIDESEWEFADDADGALSILNSPPYEASHDDSMTTVWLIGGTIGQTYQLTNRVTTAGGRVMDQTVKIRVKAK